MKKIILIGMAVIILGGVGYITYQLATEKTDFKKVGADPKNTTYVIEENEITLVSGRSEKTITPISASKIITQYFGNEVKADFNNDQTEDVAFLLTQVSGGSGTFYYVAVALNQKDGFRGTNAILLGDRIAPQTTEFRNGEIIVNYADRKLGEPMTTDPSVGVSRYFTIEKDELIEIKK